MLLFCLNFDSIYTINRLLVGSLFSKYYEEITTPLFPKQFDSHFGCMWSPGGNYLSIVQKVIIECSLGLFVYNALLLNMKYGCYHTQLRSEVI